MEIRHFSELIQQAAITTVSPNLVYCEALFTIFMSGRCLTAKSTASSFNNNNNNNNKLVWFEFIATVGRCELRGIILNLRACIHHYLVFGARRTGVVLVEGAISPNFALGLAP